MRTADCINTWESFDRHGKENHFVDVNKMVDLVKKGN